MFQGLWRWYEYSKATPSRRREAKLAETPAGDEELTGHGVEEALKAMGFGSLQWGLFVIGGLSLMADGVEIGFVSYVGEAVGEVSSFYYSGQASNETDGLSYLRHGDLAVSKKQHLRLAFLWESGLDLSYSELWATATGDKLLS